MRSNLTDTVPHPDFFATERRRLFLHRIAQDLAAKERFMIGRLFVDGRVVATRILLPTENSMYLYYSGYDPAWKKYSVMTTLTAECIKMAIAGGFKTVDLSTGTDVSKTRWGPEAKEVVGFRMPSSSLSGKVLFALRSRLPVSKICLPEKIMEQDFECVMPGG